MRLIYLALGWTLGIVLAANAGLRLPALWLALAVMAGLLAWRVRRVEVAALLLFMLGGLRMSSAPTTSDIAAYNGLGGMTITGIVAGEPDRRDDRVLLRVAVESVTRAGVTAGSAGFVLVEAPPITDAHYGDKIAATGLLTEPGESDRFSYADYLARGGVYSLMRESSVTVSARAAGNDLTSLLISLKTDAERAIKSALPEPQAGLLVGMLLGDQRGIAPEISDAFAQTGAAHVIAISGFNMAVLSGVVIGLLRRLKLRPAPAAILAIFVIAAYTLLVGANPAVVRAALMSGLLVVGRALRRETYLPASLAFAALLLSLLNPLLLWDVSFQLSFFATLGLALFAERFESSFTGLLRRIFPSRIAQVADLLLTEPLVVSAAALTLTLPLTALYFGTVSPVALLVNGLILPVQPTLLLIGAAATLSEPILPILAQELYLFNLLPLSWTIDVVRLFARLPSYEVFIAANGVAAFFVLILGCAMIKAAQPRWSIKLGGWISRRVVIGAALVSGVGVALLIGALLVSRPDGLLHIWMLDMGGGNAVLVTTPRGAHFLIDGGRYPSRLLTALGERLPFTSRALEVLFLTQPDEAQFAALPAVLDRYDWGTAITNGQPNLSAAFADLQATLAARPVLNARAGYSLDTDDGVHIEALSPPGQPALDASLDANALVLRLSYGDVSFLLTSELNSAGQLALVKSGRDLRSSVLQIPAQAFTRSLEADFVAAVQPQVAVVQADAPDPDVLALVGEIPLYRTDEGGTIHLSSDGRSLWVAQDEQP